MFLFLTDTDLLSALTDITILVVYNLLNIEMWVGNENLLCDQQQLTSALALSIQVINIFRDEDTTTPLGNPLLGCTIP